MSAANHQNGIGHDWGVVSQWASISQGAGFFKVTSRVTEGWRDERSPPS